MGFLRTEYSGTEGSDLNPLHTSYKKFTLLLRKCYYVFMHEFDPIKSNTLDDPLLQIDLQNK
jgi:hypothetical protein